MEPGKYRRHFGQRRTSYDRRKERCGSALIMELFMPGLDALGVMHAVKSEGLAEPVFIVTASYSAPALERQVMEAGASYFAIQPYNKAEMIDRILALTGASSHAAAAGPSRSDPGLQGIMYRPAHSGHGDSAPDRRSRPHQGLPLSAGLDHHGNRGAGNHQCRHKAALPERCKAV